MTFPRDAERRRRAHDRARGGEGRLGPRAAACESGGGDRAGGSARDPDRHRGIAASAHRSPVGRAAARAGGARGHAGRDAPARRADGRQRRRPDRTPPPPRPDRAGRPRGRLPAPGEQLPDAGRGAGFADQLRARGHKAYVRRGARAGPRHLVPRAHRPVLSRSTPRRSTALASRRASTWCRSSSRPRRRRRRRVRHAAGASGVGGEDGWCGWTKRPSGVPSKCSTRLQRSRRHGGVDRCACVALAAP